jgi:hypothetical protein
MLSGWAGNLKGGADDITSHRFFSGVDWRQLESRRFVAGGNLKPTLKGESNQAAEGRGG